MKMTPKERDQLAQLFHLIMNEPESDRRDFLRSLSRFPVADASQIRHALALYEVGHRMSRLQINIETAMDYLGELATQLNEVANEYRELSEIEAVDSGAGTTLIPYAAHSRERAREVSPDPFRRTPDSLDDLPDFVTESSAPPPIRSISPPLHASGPQGTADDPIDLTKFSDDHSGPSQQYWSYCPLCDAVRPEHTIDQCRWSPPWTR